MTSKATPSNLKTNRNGSSPTSPNEAISEQLRRVYADILAEPVPPEITDLVRQIEGKQRQDDQ